MPASRVIRTIDAVWRIESALEQWPESGVPDNPSAWLMGTAGHRAIDRLRRAGVKRAVLLGRIAGCSPQNGERVAPA